MRVWLENKGFSCGINSGGNLFVGNLESGANVKDTPNNRKMIIKEFFRYTDQKWDEMWVTAIEKQIDKKEKEFYNFKNNLGEENIKDLKDLCTIYKKSLFSFNKEINDEFNIVFDKVLSKNINCQMVGMITGIIDNEPKLLKNFENLLYNTFNNLCVSNGEIDLFIKDQCPALKHLSTKGREDLRILLKENMGMEWKWEDIKKQINLIPELKDLKNEINECKIKEFKLVTKNLDLAFEGMIK